MPKKLFEIAAVTILNTAVVERPELIAQLSIFWLSLIVSIDFKLVSEKIPFGREVVASTLNLILLFGPPNREAWVVEILID